VTLVLLDVSQLPPLNAKDAKDAKDAKENGNAVK
jgi:hypothetical protein